MHGANVMASGGLRGRGSSRLSRLSYVPSQNCTGSAGKAFARASCNHAGVIDRHPPPIPEVALAQLPEPL